MNVAQWPTEGTPLAAGVKPPGLEPVTWEILGEIVRRIVSALQPEKIILFGSYAYGRPSPDSDVDLLVVMETAETPANRYVTISNLIRPRPFPVDILVKTPDEIATALKKGDFFIKEIISQGQLLYERPH